MEKKKRSLWPVALGLLLTATSILAALILYAEYKLLLSAGFAILAVLFVWVICTENPREKREKKARPERKAAHDPKEERLPEKTDRESKGALKSSRGSDKQIARILEGINVNQFLSDPGYGDSGVQLIGINTNRTIRLILTEDSLYEGISATYQSPEKGAERTGFRAGPEDGERPGCCGIRLEAEGKTEDLYMVILRKDLAERHGAIFYDCPEREGAFYNSYKVSRIDGVDRCAELAEQMTALLKTAAKKAI